VDRQKVVLEIIDPELDNPDVIRGMLCGLLFECPLGGNPRECQGHAIRELPVIERIRWLQTLSEAECREIYLRHMRCLESKLAAESREGSITGKDDQEVQTGRCRVKTSEGGQ
jgi:hypothetical protein